MIIGYMKASDLDKFLELQGDGFSFEFSKLNDNCDYIRIVFDADMWVSEDIVLPFVQQHGISIYIQDNAPEYMDYQDPLRHLDIDHLLENLYCRYEIYIYIGNILANRFLDTIKASKEYAVQAFDELIQDKVVIATLVSKLVDQELGE